MLAKPASILRAGATLTPEFAVRNPLRDIQNAFIVSKSGFNPIIDFPVGLASAIKRDELYTQWLKEGGGYGNILSMDRQAHKQAIESIIKQPITKQFINVIDPRSWINIMRSISDITESATKIGEFRAALRVGETPAEAAFRARDLMDFARAGSSIRPANRVVAFLNANIQGKSKLIRAIKENPAKVTAKLAASMVMPTIGVVAFREKFANDKQKRIIQDAPDWLKNSFWLMPVPGTDLVARVPKPFDVSFAANATERFLDFSSQRDPEAFDGFLKSTIKDQSLPVMLTGILPFLEAATNYSFFREAPIVPLREQGLKREDQFDSRTSEISKAIAQPISKILGDDSNFASPRAIDYVLRSSTAGLGNYFLDSVDYFLDKTGVVDRPPKPERGITQAPLLKGFLVSETSSGKSIGELYDLRDSLTREKGSAELKDETFGFTTELNLVKLKTKQISKISKEIREINESEFLSPESKRRMINKLNAERNKIAFEAARKLRGDLK